MPAEIDVLVDEIEEILGHPLANRVYLETALTHRSYVNELGAESMEDNERLEFLGDSVLDLVVSDLLMQRNPQEPEGGLSKFRSAVVNERSLATAARAMDLGDYLKLGRGEELTAGRGKDSILANAFEAVIAALYLSGGLSDAAAFVRHHLNEVIDGVKSGGERQDYKTTLQEYTQKLLKTIPTYVLTYEGGPDHDKIFESEVWIDDKVYGRGRAKSKKDSEQLGAMEALQKLQEEETGGES
ncbi:MAG: ribonuclease III [Pseudomonadota bacterium]